jgi:hypothetical protein
MLIFAIPFSELPDVLGQTIVFFVLEVVRRQNKNRLINFGVFPSLPYIGEASTAWPLSGVGLLLRDA